MGFFLSMPHSRRAILNILVSALLFTEIFNFNFVDFRHDSANQSSLLALAVPKVQFLIMSDIPGRKPSNFSTGRAFTSKVFRSY